MKQGSDQFNYTDGHENKIDPSMFEKDYVLKDDQEQNKPQYKTDNFTETREQFASSFSSTIYIVGMIPSLFKSSTHPSKFFPVGLM